MTPTTAERDTIFKAFGRAFFKQDLDAMYQVVTPDFVWSVQGGDAPRQLTSREAIVAYFAERKQQVENVRFHDVVYHHAPDATFMTFRITGTDKTTGRAFENIGVERYTFRGGRLAVKDVYTKLAGAA
ncbi:nuclear transport factor 2 family protein [Reyranella sp. CPCC 100927]|uniref:nuclear transport factor 2 family protein n=1 Tax=Reyranella sp. CPCC 100927 TaxID=2599616 RepID=UPI0011B75F3F|nr:nuclear transport factor 2 family protein [Reyranella sp. CPCC 100927]TWT14977.1 nuclear transport factor 2 family protein [Reyranella sp. CPCC 100927]